MKKLGVLLLLAMALPLLAKVKHKEKHFDPLPVTAARAVGRYVGIDPDVVVELTPNGGTFRNFARTATLNNVVFDGSEMTAIALYNDGRTEPFAATFGNQVLNGVATYGLRLRNIDIRVDDSTTLHNLFCRRR